MRRLVLSVSIAMIVGCTPAPAPSTVLWQETTLHAVSRAVPATGPGPGVRSSLDAKAFSVRIEAVDVAAPPPEVTAPLDPTLVPLRDARIARLRATLAQGWDRATRGLSHLTVVTGAFADLVVSVLPGRGQSFHAIPADRPRVVGLFVVGDLGDSAEYFDMSALHEIGHSWCCFGPEADGEGHWREKIADPQLAGPDRFGLLTAPVECVTRGAAVVRCPHLFSDRELRTMGFTDLPRAAVDPCVAESVDLKARVAPLDAAVASSRADIDAGTAEFRRVTAQLQAIEATYPSGTLPADIRPTYAALVARYDGLRAEVDARIAAHNAQVMARNRIVSQIIALPC